jgi:glycosyltransferase involved in cell wall biosynthesis
VHNEEQLLPQLMAAVASQTILPKRWIIVDDGSTDATPDILKQYDGKFDFVVHLRLDRLAVESYYSRRAFVVLKGIKAVRRNLSISSACWTAILLWSRRTTKTF